MTEQEQISCDKVSYTGNENQPTSMDMVIPHGGRLYLISVATPVFIKEFNKYNKGFDPSVQIGERYLVMDDIPSADEVCRRLYQIPFAKLQPYLVEQFTDPVDGAGFEPATSSM